MLSKLKGSIIGTMFGMGAYHAGMYTYQFLTEYSDKIDQIPHDATKTVITTIATAGGILVGMRDHYNHKLARLYSD